MKNAFKKLVLFIVAVTVLLQTNSYVKADVTENSPTGGLLLKAPALTEGASALLNLSNSAFIKSINLDDNTDNTQIDRLKSTLELYSNFDGRRNTGIKILQDGSVVMGGANFYNSPIEPTPVIPAELPPGYEYSEHPRNSAIADFLFGAASVNNPVGQSGTYVRNVTIHDNGRPAQFINRFVTGETCPSSQAVCFPGELEASGLYGKIYPDPRPRSAPASLNWMAFRLPQGFGLNAAIGAKSVSRIGSGPVPANLYFYVTGIKSREGDATVQKARISIASNGNVGIGDGEMNPEAKLQVLGNIGATGAKFMIDHPTKPGQKLIHAAIEGPEAGVYYRGEGKLVNGQAVIELPEYFEKLTQKEGRTVYLTNKESFDVLAVKSQNGVSVENGQFTVVSKDNTSNTTFDWEVMAERADIPSLEVERVAAK